MVAPIIIPPLIRILQYRKYKVDVDAWSDHSGNPMLVEIPGPHHLTFPVSPNNINDQRGLHSALQITDFVLKKLITGRMSVCYNWDEGSGLLLYEKPCHNEEEGKIIDN